MQKISLQRVSDGYRLEVLVASGTCRAASHNVQSESARQNANWSAHIGCERPSDGLGASGG
jgi:hypothetical protein